VLEVTDQTVQLCRGHLAKPSCVPRSISTGIGWCVSSYHYYERSKQPDIKPCHASSP